MIAKSAVIFPNVFIGKNIVVEDFCIIGTLSKDQKAERTIIGNNAVIRSHTVIYAGNKIGDNFQTGNKVNLRELNIIGDNVSIGTHSVVEHHVVIKNNVRIHSLAFIPEYSVLEQGSWIGPKVVLTNAKFPKSPSAKSSLKGPNIGRNAIIGANVTILPGLKIGKNCLIGAGSVVTKNVDADTVWVGNPAKFLRKIRYQ